MQFRWRYHRQTIYRINIEIDIWHDEFKNRWPFLRSAKVDEFGESVNLGDSWKGATSLFLKMSRNICFWRWWSRGQRKNQITSYFGKKQIRFESNKDYISVRVVLLLKASSLTISFLTQWKPSVVVYRRKICWCRWCNWTIKVQDNKKTNLLNFFLEKCRVNLYAVGFLGGKRCLTS